MRILGLAVAMAALFLATTFPALAERVTLRGDVTYRERIALPEGGTLSVSLIDLAAPERPGLTATAAIASQGQVPLTFTLNFDSNSVEPNHKYALVAEIAGADGAVWFKNVEPFAVDPLTPPPAIMIVLNFQGSIGDNAAVAPEEPAIVPILDITWRAQSIGGKPVARGTTSSLSIASADMRAGGRGGCNNWVAQAQVNAQALAFSAVAATRMACIDDAATAQEQAFFDALAQTRFWRMADNHLTLLDAAGGELAVLEKSRF